MRQRADTQTAARCCMPAASRETMDLETKPEVSGNDEIESAPTIPHIAVSGMVRKSPPRSVHLRLPVMVKHRASRHQQQRLVDDMGEGVRRGAVERHLGADADPDHHESDLVHDRIGEDTAHVVFEDRVDDPVKHHDQPDIDQEFGPGKTAQQHIDRGLGGEGGTETPCRSTSFPDRRRAARPRAALPRH